ncbi:MAG: glycosyltransferase [Bacteroidaceae bacterium]|nr:glycosyltransferase [Bacteroidaceae bacterium]
MAQQLDFSYEKEKVLSLCLPTYNRAHCLREQFKRILTLKQADLERIEIIVSDNCSTDETPQVVDEFREKLLFTYLRNQENIGSNRNFLQCLRKATGKYVWLLGDDDYLQTTHMTSLLDQLEQNDYGMVHINVQHNDKIEYHEYEQLDDFLVDIHVWITFMSANIDNTRLVQGLALEEFAKTWLLQVPAHLHAALKGKKNLMVNLPFFDAAAELESNGGYNVFEVFVKNLVTIYNKFEESGISTNTLMLLKNRISDFIFPYYFNYVLLKKPCNFKLDNARPILMEYLGPLRIFYSAIKFLFSPKMIWHWIKKLSRPVKKILTYVSSNLFLILWPEFMAKGWKKYRTAVISRRFRNRIGQCGKCNIEGIDFLSGGKYMHIGQNFNSLGGLRLECLPQPNQRPQLIIGDNVNFNSRVHIGVVNKVQIGNNVLLGSNVLITDHSHGQTDMSSLQTPPRLRELYSKGPVIIDDDVWIGENACILPGVHIGKGAVVGAGAIVTHDVTPYTVVAGTPAKTISSRSTSDTFTNP